MKQIPLDILAQSDHSFETYLPGPNEWAVAQLREWVPQQAGQGAWACSAQAPVYLWGERGVGKTHLLTALASLWVQRGARVAWFSARTPLPWGLAEGLDLIVLDECEQFSAEQQHGAFALFVDAATRGVQLMTAGQLPPVDLPLREDLRTRLGWGHILALRPASEAQSRAVLRREADRRGLFLSDEVMDYLLSRFARDLKHLMGLLARLDAFALTHKRGLTVPLLRQMLNEEMPV